MIPSICGAFALGAGLGIVGSYLYNAYSTAKQEEEKMKIQEEAEKTLSVLEDTTVHCTQNATDEPSAKVAEETETLRVNDKNNDSGGGLLDEYELEHGIRIHNLYNCNDCSIQHNRNLAERAFGEILGTPCDLVENASICSQCSIVSRAEEILCRQKDPVRIVCSKCGYHENKLYAKKVIDRKYGSGTFDQKYTEENPLCIDCMEDQLTIEGFKRTAICEMCGREFIVPRMEGLIGPKFGYAELDNIRNEVGNVCGECAMAGYYSEHERNSDSDLNSEERRI